ncbi:hypothetical protein BHC43_08265 [Snodgrassella alvi]|nr:hypothetical protein BHC43_08265 [Snodgrassella alvi]
MSGQVTVGYGASASASFSKSKIKADYAAVTEQSGIIAGDNGYQLNIKGNTDLKGAIITSTAAAEAAGKNQVITGSLTSSDIQNHSDYSGSSIGIGASGSVSGSTLGQKQPTGNDKINLANQGETGASKSLGFGHDSGHSSSTTHSGINTSNIIITDAAAQQQKTGKSVAETIAGIHTDTSSDNYADKAGYLSNNFDKDKVQKELDTQREVTQEFDQNRQELRNILHKIADNKRQQAENIRKDNYIDGKNGYNTNESLALEGSADKWDKAAFYTDMILGTVYGYGNTAALVYADGGAIIDPAVRAARRPIQIWNVTCAQDGLYCSNNSYDNKKTRPIDADSPYAEIGNKRQIFDINEIKPGQNTGVITISNPGILNPLNDALKNAVKQNLWETGADGIYVAANPPTSNFLSEGVYAFYDKVNDLGGSYLPLTNSEKANILLYEYAKEKGYKIDLSNHSRGGMTASNALQYANRNGLTGIPIREARFYGTATNVQQYADQLLINGYEGSKAYSAVHYTDFVGRSPLILFRSQYTIGGNPPTGGVEDKPFMYSHSSYFREKPKDVLVDEKGRNIDANGNLTGDKKVDNPYLDDWNKKWLKGSNHNLNQVNPSLPVLVKPSKARQGVK